MLAVAAQNNNTIVIVHSVGPLAMEPWIDHPNVTAVGCCPCQFFFHTPNNTLKVVWAGIPGQESGNSLVDVMYGDWNPSGRLPYTIAKNINDYPSQRTLGGGPDDIISIPYTEGLFTDYRHFDAVSLLFFMSWGRSRSDHYRKTLHLVSNSDLVFLILTLNTVN